MGPGSQIQSLADLARAAARNAYAPYSRFHVGAAVRSTTGRAYVGANVENVSYPVGTCAETAALSAGRAAEGAAFKPVEIVIIAMNAAGEQQACTPCGACRQRIVEFNPHANVRYSNDAASFVSRTAVELLPDQFSFRQA